MFVIVIIIRPRLNIKLNKGKFHTSYYDFNWNYGYALSSPNANVMTRTYITTSKEQTMNLTLGCK